MATRKQWEQVEHWADTNCFAESCMLELRARVEALEAAQHHHVEMAKPASVAEESSAAVSAPNYAARPMDADLLRHYHDARGDFLDRLRAVYDLGRQHGAAANSKPTPNFDQIRSSADTGLLPMIVSETGSDDEPEIERIICSSISGGADYVNGMPRELSLQRIRYGDLHLGSAFFSARYVQAPPGVSEPTPAPAGELKEMLTKVFNEGLRLRRYAATDVIEAVADWLEQRTDTIANGSQWAALLREEANR